MVERGERGGKIVTGRRAGAAADHADKVGPHIMLPGARAVALPATVCEQRRGIRDGRAVARAVIASGERNGRVRYR